MIGEHTGRFAELRHPMDVTPMDVTADEGGLKACVAEAEAILAEQVVIIPPCRRLGRGAVRADMVGRCEHHPPQASDAWNLELQYRKGL